MATTNDNRRETCRGPRDPPVTPPGRAISVRSPPGAPRRVSTRRPQFGGASRQHRRRRSSSVCFSTDPRMGPAAFERLLRASIPGAARPAVSVVGAGVGVGVGDGVAAAHANSATPGHVAGDMSGGCIRPRPAALWINPGFVVALEPLRDDRLNAVGAGAGAGAMVTQEANSTTSQRGDISGGESTGVEVDADGDIEMGGVNDYEIVTTELMGRVAAGIVVATGVLAAATSAANSEVVSSRRREI